MTSQPDVTRVVRSWLEEGVDRMPDRVLDSVLELVPSTPQHRRLAPARRFILMPNPVRAVLLAAAVLVAAIAGLNLLPKGGVGTAPSPTPLISTGLPPSSAPLPSPVALGNADLDRILPSGTFRIGTKFAAPFTVTLPTAWQLKAFAEGDVGFRRNKPDNGAPWINVDLLEAVVLDPCHYDPARPSPYLATVDEAVAAFQRMKGFTTGPVTDITIGGLPAKALVLTNAINTDTANCTGGPMLPIWTFRGSGPVGGGTNGGATEHLWILQVHGTIVGIDGETFPNTPPDTLQEMLQAVPTITFD